VTLWRVGMIKWHWSSQGFINRHFFKSFYLMSKNVAGTIPSLLSLSWGRAWGKIEEEHRILTMTWLTPLTNTRRHPPQDIRCIFLKVSTYLQLRIVSFSVIYGRKYSLLI
jgi:hypothetical protein